jgi:hypothetical protein
MKLVVRNYHRRWSRFIHPDLEHLRALHKVYPRQSDEIVAQFSRSVSDIIVGGFAKTTYRKRLAGTEEVLVKYLREQALPHISALDLGASDGITTVSLLAALRRVTPDVIIVLADKVFSLTLYKRGPIREYRAPDGEPIQLQIGRFAWRLPQPDHRWDLVSRVLIRLYLSCFRFRRAMAVKGRVPLLSPAASNEIALRPLEFDCLIYQQQLAGSFDAIRASNLLNRMALTEDQVKIIVRHLYAYLRDGGLLLVSRNHSEDSSREHGTLWRKESGWLKPLEHLGRGSEIEDWVERARARSC